MSGTIAVIFNKFRNIVAEIYVGESWGKGLWFARLPKYFRPIVGGAVCGGVAVFYPQTLFVGKMMI